MSAQPPTDRRGDDRVGAATILVVDDSTAIRRILGRTLVDAGYRVVEAADGRSGIDLCRAEQPDLVLLDMDMPVLDGTATLREMKADPVLRSVPVLFLTAHTGGTDVAAGLALGAQDYLRKPCEPAELTARVAVALRMRAQEAVLARQARDLDELSATDTLTGLGNRRRVEAHVAALVREDTERELAVLMVDVDHFKAVNDRFGHGVGDTVLRIVAGRLAQTADDDALVARWGGEEFVVVASGLDAEAAAEFAEALRKAVGSDPLEVAGQAVVVTVSIGCTSGSVERFDQLVDAADGALYEAKRAGRDRVSVG